MDYNLLKNRVYWGYNPLTNLLLTSWDIQEGPFKEDFFYMKVTLQKKINHSLRDPRHFPEE